MRLFVRKEMLNTLKSIDSTLKRIEQSINNDEKHTLIFAMLFLMH